MKKERVTNKWIEDLKDAQVRAIDICEYAARRMMKFKFLGKINSIEKNCTHFLKLPEGERLLKALILSIQHRRSILKALLAKDNGTQKLMSSLVTI